MKYRNLVYCKHPNFTKRAYLYELPLDKDIRPGDKLCVEDRAGEHIVTAFCENWLASDKITRVLCEANGRSFRYIRFGKCNPKEHDIYHNRFPCPG